MSELNLPIYLDHNATTPVDPRVLEAMLPWFSQRFGNAASHSHTFGRRAELAVEEARERIAALIGAGPQEVVFTSGATESDNLAIKGVAEKYRDKGNHIISGMTEHKAVLDTCMYLEKQGFDITWLRPDEFGQVTAEQVAEAITDQTILISLMAANNETGALHPIDKIAKVAKDRDVLFHCDATQAVGKLPINCTAMGIDLLSLSAHKMYGPKGVGALYVRRRDPHVRLAIQMHGGGHERGRRSGTLNTPGIVGLAEACDLAGEVMVAESRRLADLRDHFEDAMLSRVEYVRRNGHPTLRLPGTSNLSFAYIEGEAIMEKIRADIAVSSGSACTSASLEPSYVLRAMGVSDELAHGSIRFSLGRSTTQEEIDYAVDRVVGAVEYLRDMSPLFELAQERGDLSGVEWTRLCDDGEPCPRGTACCKNNPW